MPVQIVLREEQLQDLSIIRDLGSETIQSLIDKFNNLSPYPVKPAELRKVLENILPQQPDKIDIVLRQLMSLYNLRRQRDINAEELLEGINYGINTAKTRWNDTELTRWKAIEPKFHDLFSLPTVWNVVKALDLSYDYTNLLQSAKIITDIRPIFNEEATEIQGSVISYSLRLYFDSREGNKSLSVALDEKDIRKLLTSCERALKKAKTSKVFMHEQGKKATFISGEND